MILETLKTNAMENNEQLNQDSRATAEGMHDVAATPEKMKKTINGNEKKKIVKLIQPDLLPGKVRTFVKTLVEGASDTFPQDEELLGIEDIDENLEDGDAVEENTDFDFSNLTKLELVEMLEATVSETDVQKIKDKVSAIRVRFMQINKEDTEKELEQFLNGGGEADNFQHVEDEEERRFNVAFSVFKANNNHRTFWISCIIHNFYGCIGRILFII